MSNSNIKDYARLGGLARASKLTHDRRLEIAKIGSLSRGKHRCNARCLCKHCNREMVYHSGGNCQVGRTVFKCLLATRGNKQAVDKISKMNIREFSRNYNKYISTLSTGKPVEINTIYGVIEMRLKG